MTAPHPLDLSHHLSYATKNKKPSSVKEFYKYFQIPGIANFAGGKLDKTMVVACAHPTRFATCILFPL